MAELADAPDLGSGVNSCRFDSCYPHHFTALFDNAFLGLHKLTTRKNLKLFAFFTKKPLTNAVSCDIILLVKVIEP